MNEQERLESLSPLVQQYIGEQYFSGAVIALSHAQSTCSKAWGTTAMQGGPLDGSHLFDLASLTKLFTTLAVLRLIDTAMVSDQTRLLDILHFPDPVLATYLGKVTVSSLLTHTSGLPAWYPFYTRQGESFEGILHDILHSTPLQTGVVYSDLNFMLLGMVVSSVTKLSLEQAMRGLVFEPLNLKSATYHPKRSRCVATEFGNQIEKRMVSERGLHFDGWRSEQVPLCGQCNDGNGFYYFGGVAGHAGIFADATDVLAVGRAFDSKRGTFLSPDVLNRTLHDWGGGRGFGIQYGELYPNGGFGHTGFTGTYLYIHPQRDLVITILTNRLHAPVVQSINHIRIEVVMQLLRSIAS